MARTPMYWGSALLVLLATGGLSTCDGGGDCAPQDQTFCRDGVTFWVDSCGEIGEAKENCDCGCTQDHAACQRCDCACSTEDTCCDGCHALNEGQICDDGDPDSHNDTCRSGQCTGWRPEVVAPAPPAAPEAPAPVRLRSWTCPPGWEPREHAELRAEDEGPYSWCEPPPLPRLSSAGEVTPLHQGELDGDRPVCDPGTAGTYPVIGQATCQPLGAACPAGGWPEIPAEVPGARIFVRAGAVGGIGSQASPFGTVADGVAASAAGDVVVLAAGVYPESVAPPHDLTLWGACARQAQIDAPGPHAGSSAGAVVVSGGALVALHDLMISGAQNGVVVSGAGSRAELRGVWIHQATRHGVSVTGGGALLDGVLVDATRPDDEDSRGRGIGAYDGANVEVRASTIEASHNAGIIAFDPGTALDLADTTVRATRSRQSTGTAGESLVAFDGARVTGARVLFDLSREFGIWADGAGAEIDLSEVVIAETRSQEASAGFGGAVYVSEGAQVSLHRALLDLNRFVAASAATGGALVLEDAVVRDTQGQDSDGAMGRGVHAQEASSVELTRAVVEANREYGVFGGMADTVLTLTDVAILDTRCEESSGIFGGGLEAAQGAQVHLERGLLARNHQTGLSAYDPGTVLQLTDVAVTDTLSECTGQTAGVGLNASRGASVTWSRGRVLRSRESGVFAAGDGTTLNLTDLEVTGTLASEADGTVGRGLEIQGGAQVNLLRGLIDGNHDQGVFATQAGTRLAIEDVTIQNTRSRVSDGTFGRGLEANEGAQVTITRARVYANRDIGIFASQVDTEVTMEDVAILETRGREADTGGGRGLSAQEGANVELLRGHLELNREFGVFAASEGTQVTLGDVQILDTQSKEEGGWFGRGLNVQDAAVVVLTRGLVTGSHEDGVVVLSRARLTLDSVVIDRTYPAVCASLPASDPRNCIGLGGGAGLCVVGAFGTLSQVSLSGATMAGLQIVDGGRLEGSMVEIRDNPIGVNTQNLDADYDFLEAVSGLVMKDNQVNFDSSELAVPDPGEMMAD